MSTPQNRLYSTVLSPEDNYRHVIRASGADGSFPRSLCGKRVALKDDRDAIDCRDCRRQALSELALALSSFGLDEIGVAVAGEVRVLSFT